MRIFINDKTVEKGKRIYDLDPTNPGEFTAGVDAKNPANWFLPLDSSYNSEEEARKISLGDLNGMASQAKIPVTWSGFATGSLITGQKKSIGLFSVGALNVRLVPLMIILNCDAAGNSPLDIKFSYTNLVGVTGEIVESTNIISISAAPNTKNAIYNYVGSSYIAEEKTSNTGLPVNKYSFYVTPVSSGWSGVRLSLIAQAQYVGL